MKALFVIGILLVAINGQSFGMGHPHNMFAARKQMRTKPSVSIVKNKITTSTWQQAVQTTKLVISERLVAALSRVRPSRTY